PGIAGIVLTLGMAIDANVLIFARIREELKNGASAQRAIHEGFDKAFTAILDSNLTTLLVGAILFAMASGPIKGFAVTLSLGIVTSLFSAILVTRAMINLILGGRTGRILRRNWLRGAEQMLNNTLNFMRWRKPFYVIALVFCLASIASRVVKGLNFSLDFTGGAQVELRYSEPVDLAA